MSRWALKQIYRVHPPGQTAGMVMAVSGVQTSATCKMIASSQGTEKEVQVSQCSLWTVTDFRSKFYQQQFRRTRFQNFSHHFQQVWIFKTLQIFFFWHTFKQESLHGAAEAVIKSPDNRNHLHHSSGHVDCIMTKYTDDRKSFKVKSCSCSDVRVVSHRVKVS